jgi:hypothetical protein
MTKSTERSKRSCLSLDPRRGVRRRSPCLHVVPHLPVEIAVAWVRGGLIRGLEGGCVWHPYSLPCYSVMMELASFQGIGNGMPLRVQLPADKDRFCGDKTSLGLVVLRFIACRGQLRALDRHCKLTSDFVSKFLQTRDKSFVGALKNRRVSDTALRLESRSPRLQKSISRLVFSTPIESLMMGHRPI